MEQQKNPEGLEIISLFAVISYDFETSHEEPELISLLYADNAEFEVFVHAEKPRVHILLSSVWLFQYLECWLLLVYTWEAFLWIFLGHPWCESIFMYCSVIYPLSELRLNSDSNIMAAIQH